MENISYRDLWITEFEKFMGDVQRRNPVDEWKYLISQEEIVYIYGAGHLGKVLASCLHKCGQSVTAFVDRDPEKKNREIVFGIHCILPEQMKKHALILIAVEEGNQLARDLCQSYSNKVYNASNLAWLKINKVGEMMHWSHEKLEEIKKRTGRVFDMLDDLSSQKTYYYILRGIFLEKPYHDSFQHSFCDRNEYFRKEIFKSEYAKNFVDCGAYEGDTFEEYLNFVGRNFEAAYLFEMGAQSADVLRKNVMAKELAVANKTHIFCMGVYDHAVEMMTTDSVHEGMKIVDGSGNQKQYLDALDHCLANKIVDFIKMDIEGSEMAALRGAKNLIQRHKPDLAICIYHKVEDLWEIPEYIRQIEPGYHIYIRHCSHYDQDMILYATIR